MENQNILKEKTFELINAVFKIELTYALSFAEKTKAKTKEFDKFSRWINKNYKKQ